MSSRVEAQFLLRYLREFPELKGDWYILRAGHWACGWIEQIAFKVLEDNPEIEATQQKIDKLEDIIAEARSAGLPTSELEEQLWGLRNHFDDLEGPTEIFERLLDWHGAAEYDQDGFLEERDKEIEEQAIEDIRNAWRIRVKSGVPESWCKEVYDVMSRKGQINEEPSGDLYISSDHINSALQELGYYDDDDE